MQVSSTLARTIAFTLVAVAAARAEPPLVDAAMNGDRDAVRALLEGADVDATQRDGMTALHWAVHRDDAAMTAVLLQAGASPAALNRTGIRPLYLAAVNGNAETVRLLLDAGEDANAVLTGEAETVLMFAARTGKPDVVRLLLERGADVNARQARGQTAAMWAAYEGHAEVLRMLIAVGADLGASSAASTRAERRPAGGMTALLFAARGGHLEAVRALLDGGADVNQTGADNTSPLLIAVVNGHYGVASLLLARGANPSVADRNGRTPLYTAIDLRNVQWSQAPAPELPQSQHLAMIRALLDAGADVEAKLTGKIKHRGSFDMRWTDLEGGTPFLRAAWNGDIEVMRLLLEHGADPTVATADGETALLLFAGAGWPLGQGHLREDADMQASLALLVEELGLDVNAATADGITPLIGAVFKGTNDVVTYLVEHGARLDVKDGKGRTVLDWARGIAANEGQPPRPMPETEALLLELLKEQGVTIASATP